jgi:predicted O-methyltransferase YrrM
MRILLDLYRMAYLGLERVGVHVTPRHHAFPLPIVAALDDSIWDRPSEIAGLDFREAEQLQLLALLAQRYRDEYERWPRQPRHGAPFHLDNRHFECVDAQVLHGLMRQRRPRRFLEAGAGFSTLVALEAAAANAREGHSCALEAYDPGAAAALRARAGPGFALHATPVQRVPLSAFTSLAAGDILFIDSSHILQVGSDVRFLFGEVIPRLQPGVLVHVHDVFLPAEYPRHWVKERMRFWNEQYLLQAFLCFNPSFRVVWASHFMALRQPQALADAFSCFTPRDQPASFWFERVG